MFPGSSVRIHICGFGTKITMTMECCQECAWWLCQPWNRRRIRKWVLTKNTKVVMSDDNPPGLDTKSVVEILSLIPTLPSVQTKIRSQNVSSNKSSLLPDRYKIINFSDNKCLFLLRLFFFENLFGFLQPFNKWPRKWIPIFNERMNGVTNMFCVKQLKDYPCVIVSFGHTGISDDMFSISSQSSHPQSSF